MTAGEARVVAAALREKRFGRNRSSVLASGDWIVDGGRRPAWARWRRAACGGRREGVLRDRGSEAPSDGELMRCRRVLTRSEAHEDRDAAAALRTETMTRAVHVMRSRA